MANTSLSPALEIEPAMLPSYNLSPAPPLIEGISDTHLALALPLLAYWSMSLAYHIIDLYDLLPQYRIHTATQSHQRNKVGRWDCLRDVLVQQFLQTAAGLVYAAFSQPEMIGMEGQDVLRWVQRLRTFQRALPDGLTMLVADLTAPEKKYLVSTPTPLEIQIASAMYHYIVPTLQLLVAMSVIDTWQYFLHRLMHTNKWCYRTFHIRHHRLYVPYAYGALYNHPLEGFVGDTIGTGIAFMVSGMTTRQGMLLFTLATIKTVDDHCGYRLPWDPFQLMSENNAEYHNIHHQSWGMKTNFAQPFFTFWDAVLGTKWTGSVQIQKNKKLA